MDVVAGYREKGVGGRNWKLELGLLGINLYFYDTYVSVCGEIIWRLQFVNVSDKCSSFDDTSEFVSLGIERLMAVDGWRWGSVIVGNGMSLLVGDGVFFWCVKDASVTYIDESVMISYQSFFGYVLHWEGDINYKHGIVNFRAKGPEFKPALWLASTACTWQVAAKVQQD